MGRGVGAEEGADIDSCPQNQAAFQDIRATAAPRQPRLIRPQPRYQTASAISNRHKQTLAVAPTAAKQPRATFSEGVDW